MRFEVLSCSMLLCMAVFTTNQLKTTAAQKQDNLTCIENPTGEVSLNVAVRGVPGPEGPQGSTGGVGPRGVKGQEGLRGLRGLTGDRGDIGGVGQTGPKGEIGTKGQKGSRGIQGIPGSVGSSGLVGPRGSRGYPGDEGSIGHNGPPGLPGPRGPQGEEGDTVLSNEEFNRVSERLSQSLLAKLQASMEALNNSLQETVNSIYSRVEDNAVMIRMLKENAIHQKCGIVGPWRQLASFDTAEGDTCQSDMRTIRNATTGQIACGRTNRSGGCASLKFHTTETYTNICGRVRGYQENTPDSFHSNVGYGIDDAYANGVLISRGNPRKHVWSFAAGISENSRYSEGSRYICPCARQPFTDSDVPDFVGQHYFCESGHSSTSVPWYGVLWDDALWDGQNCPPGNQCCKEYGWFHRVMPPSSDYLELRVCADQPYSNEDVPIDQYEFWVM